MALIKMTQDTPLVEVNNLAYLIIDMLKGAKEGEYLQILLDIKTSE